jgi:hypothetical protein
MPNEHRWTDRKLCSIISARGSSGHRRYNLPKSTEMLLYIALLFFLCFHAHFEMPNRPWNPSTLRSLASHDAKNAYHSTAFFMFSSILSFCTDNNMSETTLPESASMVSSRRGVHRFPGLFISAGIFFRVIHSSWLVCKILTL